MNPTSEHILDNGLKVIISESHATATACCSIWYRAGSKHETSGATGLAHLLEHMMFKGTRRFPKGELDATFHRNGAISNASTWLDRTNYYELISTDRLELILDLEADRMRGALFTQSDLDDEMTVVRNELERNEDDPFTNLFERIQSTAFLEHPYHWPTIGWRSDVEAIRADQIHDFYNKFYQPNNAFVVIVGAVETREALRLVEKYVGSIPPGPGRPPVVTVEPPQKGERRVIIRKPGENDLLGLAYRIPQRLHPDNYALDLLGQILGQGRTSRLYKSLVEQKLAVAASAMNFSTLEDPYLFFLDAEVSPGVKPDDVEAAIDGTIRELQESPALAAELERAQKRNRVAYIYRKDRVSGQAFFLGELEASCGWRFGLTYLDEMEQVTIGDIQRVARQYLIPNHRTVGRYLAVREGEETITSVPELPSQKVEGPGEETIEWDQALGTAGRPVKSPSVKTGSGALPKTHREVLDNGATLLVRSNRSNQTIEIAGRFEGGMLLEGAGRGMTHALAQMWDRGTQRRKRAEIAEILEGLGAGISFQGSIEVFGFNMKCLSEDLETVTGLLAEMLKEPAFPDEEWEIVRAQMLNTIRESRQDTFDRAYYRCMEMLCGAENLYARFPMGSEEDLAGISVADLSRLHSKALAASSLTVAAVGDVEAGDAIDLLRRTLGDLVPGRPFPTREEARRWTGFAPPAGSPRDHVELPEKFQVDMVFAKPGLARDDAGYDPAYVANFILGGYFSSRLSKQLRDNEGLTYGVYSRLRPGLGIVPWYISIGVHPSNMEKAREGVLREMKILCETGVKDDEFEDAIQHLTGSFPVRLETNRAVADMLLDGERYGHGPDVIEKYVDRLRRIKKADVETQAVRLFEPESMVLASAGTLKVPGATA
ncbi:MAG: insulinase family protein [Candidatus Eisenbacteria bacterium]|nr:insulinase family protein [Candidatus Eisenbacteria bacterium]